MPTSLTATKIKDTYGQILHVDGGVTSTPKLVYDGDGTATALKVSTTGIEVPTLVLSAGTANSIPYLNGSKVLTTGSALTFDGTKLAVTGGNYQLSIGASAAAYDIGRNNATGVFTFYGNQASYVTYLFSGVNGDYLKLAADSQIFSINASEQMRLTSTGLGIGTSSPSYKLQVNQNNGGIAVAASAGSSAQLLLSGNANTLASGSFDILQGGNNVGYIYNRANAAIEFATNNTARMTLDSSGNLGLGVTPSAWGGGFVAAQVKGASMWTDGNTRSFWSTNVYFDGSTRRFISSNPAFEYSQTSTGHAWLTTGSGTAGNAISFTQAMTLDASGNLGIGTSSPGGRLHVVGTQDQIRAGNGTNTAFLGANNSLGYVGTLSNDPFLLYTNATERMRIDSSGNLLVGTTSSLAKATVNNGNVVQFTGAWRNDNSGTQYFHSFNYNGMEIGSIKGSNTSTSYVTSSDYRLKENIQPMQGALDVVAQLNPVTYNWKADGSDGQGFIAHELQAVVPDCVTGEKDAVDAEGKPVYQGVDTSFLVATLTKAIQEQQEQINQLTARVAQLEGN